MQFDGLWNELCLQQLKLPYRVPKSPVNHSVQVKSKASCVATFQSNRCGMADNIKSISSTQAHGALVCCQTYTSASRTTLQQEAPCYTIEIAFEVNVPHQDLNTTITKPGHRVRTYRQVHLFSSRPSTFDVALLQPSHPRRDGCNCNNPDRETVLSDGLAYGELLARFHSMYCLSGRHCFCLPC
jgi:hypothetical protein